MPSASGDLIPAHAVVIDDSDIDRYLIGRQIELFDERINVTEYASGTDALMALTLTITNQNDAKLPDIILVDINMPGMNGFEFIEQFTTFLQSQAQPLNTHIYIISSSTNDSDFSKAQSMACVDGFISKPPSIEDVGAAILGQPVNNTASAQGG